MVQAKSDDSMMERVMVSLRQALGPCLVALVLFGSHARQDASADSDWDILLIADDLPSGTLDRHLFLKRALPAAYRGAISVIAKTRREFETGLPALYLDIALDGRILYDPTGYARDRLAALRRIIERHGLRREHTPAGDYWHWEQPPGATWAIEWEV